MPPIDPAGMIVDWISQPYSEWMYFSPGVQTKVNWYFVPPGTPLLPYATPFRSGKWLEQPWPQWIGPVYPAKWPRRPNVPARPAGTGTPIGTPDQWINGADPSLNVPIVPPGVPQGTIGNFSGFLSGQGRGKLGSALRARARGYLRLPQGERIGVSALFHVPGTLHGTTGLLAGVRASYNGSGSLPAAAGVRESSTLVSQAPAALSARDGLLDGSSLSRIVGREWRGTDGLTEGLAAAVDATGSLSGRTGLQDGANAVDSGKAVVNGSVPSEEQANAVLDGDAKASGSDPGKASVSALLASFSVVTPSGACGSLPASMVCRMSAHTGTCSALDGTAVTITWNGISWIGSFGTMPNVTSVSLLCAMGSWKLALSGHYNTTTPITMTGSSGASPSLTGTGAISGACSGNETMALTRT